jgi:hypothetical protein
MVAPFSHGTDLQRAAWRRFRRLMLGMMVATVMTVIGVMSVLYAQEGMVSIHFYIATAIGITFAMLLMSALMGLVFLSNASGHDAAVVKPEQTP